MFARLPSPVAPIAVKVLLLVALGGCRPGGVPGQAGQDGDDPVRLEHVALGFAPDVGLTWFSSHPGIPTLGVVSTHREWNSHSLRLVELDGERWSPTGVAPFAGDGADRAGRFSPDGSLLFSSRRSGSEGDWDLWIVRITDGRWGEAMALPAPVNTAHRDYHGSVSRSGSIYFVSNRPGSVGEGDIYRAVPGPGGYTIEHLPTGVNTELWEVDVFVAPGEEFILFARTDSPQGLGGDDIFVAFREESGWSEPRVLSPPVNSASYDYGAHLSSDGRYLTFTSDRSGIAQVYRVRTDALDLGGAFDLKDIE